DSPDGRSWRNSRRPQRRVRGWASDSLSGACSQNREESALGSRIAQSCRGPADNKCRESQQQRGLCSWGPSTRLLSNHGLNLFHGDQGKPISWGPTLPGGQNRNRINAGSETLRPLLKGGV